MISRPGIVATVALLGCTTPPEPVSPPPGLDHAYAAPSCAPWDGYAVSLVLRKAPLSPGDSAIEAGDAPQLRLALYPREIGPAPSGIRPETYRWPSEPEMAIGSWCEGGQCASFTSGTVTIREAAADGRLKGSVEVRRNGQTIEGSFDAEWRPRRMFCL